MRLILTTLVFSMIVSLAGCSVFSAHEKEDKSYYPVDSLLKDNLDELWQEVEKIEERAAGVKALDAKMSTLSLR